MNESTSILQESYSVWDIQKEDLIEFPDLGDLQLWLAKRYFGIILSLLLGVAMVVYFWLGGIGPAATCYFFVPYMTRHFIRRGQWDVFVFDLFRVILYLFLAVTLIYPVYKLCQELNTYTGTRREYGI